jgi:hypothetical protein
MGLIEILIGVVFTLAVGVGVAMTTSASASAEFWVARGCFGVASVALLVAYFVWIWSAPRDPAWRVLIGTLIGVLAVSLHVSSAPIIPPPSGCEFRRASLHLGASFENSERPFIAPRIGLIDKGDQKIGERSVVPQFQLSRIDPAFEIVIQIAP